MTRGHEMSTKQANCEERIDGQFKGRFADIRDLVTLAGGDAKADISDERAEELGVSGDEWVGDQATESIDSYILGVSGYAVAEIEISTGGPADWLEIRYVPGDEIGVGAEITEVRYHFADWFDHAEYVPTREECGPLEDFARRVVPELLEAD